MPTFAEVADDRWDWITAFPRRFCPDEFDDARKHYQPFVTAFTALALMASDSTDLLRQIMRQREPPRVQLLRIFNRYVSPVTPVEMLKSQSGAETAIRVFSHHFRDIAVVRINIRQTDYHDALSVMMWEFKERGQLGYKLTNRFFAWFKETFPGEEWSVTGPLGAGRDIDLRNVVEGYYHECPTDILITYMGEPVVAGFARYDSDRGGAQESDRIGGNRAKILDIIQHKNEAGIPLKIFFLNDGPGLGLGLMWKRYAEFESINPTRILVATLKMIPTRLTREWMLGG